MLFIFHQNVIGHHALSPGVSLFPSLASRSIPLLVSLQLTESQERSEMADRIAKGEEFEKKADKKINGWGLFGSKFEDAAELYEHSANSFKLAKSCTFG